MYKRKLNQNLIACTVVLVVLSQSDCNHFFFYKSKLVLILIEGLKDHIFFQGCSTTFREFPDVATLATTKLHEQKQCKSCLLLAFQL